MARLKRASSSSFEVQIQDLTLRVNAPEDYYEECRAAALSIWEQLQSYGIRQPDFRRSKRPVEVPESAPAIARDMASLAARAGVGPMFVTRGAVVDYVGRYLARNVHEIQVSCDGTYFLRSRRPVRVPVHQPSEGEPLAIVVAPGKEAIGVATTFEQRGQVEGVDGLAVVATSCTLAQAAAAAAGVILSRPNAFRGALAYLRRIDGVYGALLVQGERIGVAGRLEVAA